MSTTDERITAAFRRAEERAAQQPAGVPRHTLARLSREVPTMFEAPHRSAQELAQGDAAFLGIPFEGVTVADPRTLAPQGAGALPGAPGYSRAGAYEAPDAIRAASIFSSLDHSGGFLPELDGLRVLDHVGCADLGNLPGADAHPLEVRERAVAAIEQIVRAGAVPLVLGGDHTIPWFTCEPIARARDERIGILVFDSHYDLWSEPRWWAGSQWAQLMRADVVAPANLVIVGIRGTRHGVAERLAAEELGIRTYTMADVWRLGAVEVCKRAIEQALDGVDRLYVSFDIDCVDPAFCPGQKYPEPGGLTARETVEVVREAAATGALCGYDVCCFSPSYDQAGYGAQLVARTYLEALAGVALAHRA